MKSLRITLAISLALSLTAMYGQNQTDPGSGKPAGRRFSVSTTYYSFMNFGEEKTNTHHYEIHAGYRLTPNDRIGIKLATWKMFAPMGMPMAEQLKFDETNFYPGRLQESGIGVTYQRMLWKGLFASVEVLPQMKRYIDSDGRKIANGFKLYTSYHLGYQINFRDRFYLEPQVHCQYWPVDTNTPQSFREKDNSWNNYFLFEPNLYIGFRF